MLLKCGLLGGDAPQFGGVVRRQFVAGLAQLPLLTIQRLKTNVPLKHSARRPIERLGKRSASARGQMLVNVPLSNRHIILLLFYKISNVQNISHKVELGGRSPRAADRSNAHLQENNLARREGGMRVGGGGFLGISLGGGYSNEAHIHESALRGSPCGSCAASGPRARSSATGR